VTFKLDGQLLRSEYDEGQDILYLWVDEPRPATTYETEQGHLVRLDPETYELVGVTILDFRRRWKGRDIVLQVPQVEQRVLQPA
jgi:uncharacterized protein YuzE